VPIPFLSGCQDYCIGSIMKVTRRVIEIIFALLLVAVIYGSVRG